MKFVNSNKPYVCRIAKSFSWEFTEPFLNENTKSMKPAFCTFRDTEDNGDTEQKEWPSVY